MDDLEFQSVLARIRRLEVGIDDIPALQLPAVTYDTRVPTVTNLSAVSSSISARLTKAVIMWIVPDDPTNVARYEVWVSRIANGADKPYLAASVTDSPATFNITSTAAGYAVAYVVTVLKNGLSTPLTAAPSVVFQVF